VRLFRFRGLVRISRLSTDSAINTKSGCFANNPANSGMAFESHTLPRAFRCWKSNGGESGIRTHVTRKGKHAFQACAFSHSAISPAPDQDSICVRGLGRTQWIVAAEQMFSRRASSITNFVGGLTEAARVTNLVNQRCRDLRFRALEDRRLARWQARPDGLAHRRGLCEWFR
jgi:hypothetical protein